MNEIIEMVCEMSPYLLLGFFIAGIMHSFVPSSLFRSYLSGSSFRSVCYAALLGIPIPLCSCGVIPTALSLHKEGASKGASVSFLIATPQTGVDSIAATYSLMGLPFAILRPFVALFTAIFGGHLVNLVDREHAVCHDEHSCCCHHDSDTSSLSFFQKLKAALHYAFVEMVGEIGKWLVVGLVVAGLLTAFLPDDVLTVFSDRPLLGMVFVLLLAIPMYVCATGSIPIAVALMLKGLSPGAALVLLMAGPAVNMASILVIRKSLGKKALWVYLLSIIGGAMSFGLVVDYLLPRAWFSVLGIAGAEGCHHEHISVIGIVSAVVLGALLLYALWRHLTGKSDDCCCCHEHEEHKECCCHEHEEHKECCCHEHEHEEHKECCCHEHEHEEHKECCCHEHEHEESAKCHCHEN